jgi:tryptophan halogenase
MRPKLNIVIVGGGTAGWMTAAALARAVGPRLCSIRLIESDEIGTIGVGEATLPQIREFNDFLGIIESDFMSQCQATFKLGIEFVDWGFKGSSYIHPFGVHGQPIGGVPFFHYWLKGRQAGLETNLEDCSVSITACRRNRFDFPVKEKDQVRSTYDYAFHFDASLYAAYLRRFAESQGVKRIEGRIVDVALDPQDGAIASVKLQSGETVEGDFFVDCSGMRSLLLGQTLGVGFDDWSPWLPCDRAYAVPSENTGELTPYTRSTAREAGWQWRIPLQHRMGNGYVFSTAFTDEDRAAALLMANLEGAALGEPRLVKFKAGRRLESWRKNCVSIGLSSGFLEPLESTSIYLIQVAILTLIQLFPERRTDPAIIKEFNRLIDHEYSRVRDFLILHYHLSTSMDGELWEHCRNMSVPDSLVEKMEDFRHRGHIAAYRNGLFAPPSWLSVFLGQGLAPEAYDARLNAFSDEQIGQILDNARETVAAAVEAMSDHGEFVNDYCSARNVAPSLAAAR